MTSPGPLTVSEPRLGDGGERHADVDADLRRQRLVERYRWGSPASPRRDHGRTCSRPRLGPPPVEALDDLRGDPGPSHPLLDQDLGRRRRASEVDDVHRGAVGATTCGSATASGTRTAAVFSTTRWAARPAAPYCPNAVSTAWSRPWPFVAGHLGPDLSGLEVEVARLEAHRHPDRTGADVEPRRGELDAGVEGFVCGPRQPFVLGHLDELCPGEVLADRLSAGQRGHGRERAPADGHGLDVELVRPGHHRVAEPVHGQAQRHGLLDEDAPGEDGRGARGRRVASVTTA